LSGKIGFNGNLSQPRALTNPARLERDIENMSRSARLTFRNGHSRDIARNADNLERATLRAGEGERMGFGARASDPQQGWVGLDRRGDIPPKLMGKPRPRPVTDDQVGSVRARLLARGDGYAEGMDALPQFVRKWPLLWRALPLNFGRPLRYRDTRTGPSLRIRAIRDVEAFNELESSRDVVTGSDVWSILIHPHDTKRRMNLGKRGE